MDLQNKLVDEAVSLLKNNTVITGGHFRLFFNNGKIIQNFNQGTIVSFRLAVWLYSISISQNINTGLGLLINDMGSACEEDGCKTGLLKFSRPDFKLPEEYLSILSEYKIKEQVIELYWEKNIRNRSKKIFLKQFKKDGKMPKKQSDGFFVDDPDGYGKIILTRTIGKDKYGTPACPLIMAGLNIIQGEKYASSINFYYTGSDNIQNIPNPFVIEKGERLSGIFGSVINVNNLFFDNF